MKSGEQGASTTTTRGGGCFLGNPLGHGHLEVHEVDQEHRRHHHGLCVRILPPSHPMTQCEAMSMLAPLRARAPAQNQNSLERVKMMMVCGI